MHIIALEKITSSKLGGQELSLFDVCHSLAQQQHQITLLHCQSGNLLEQYRTFSNVLHTPSFGISRDNLIKPLLQLPIDLRRTSRALRNAQSPLLYCNQIYDISVPAILAKLHHIPLVCHLRLPAPNDLGKFHKPFIPQVNHFIAVSQHTQQEWINFGIPKDKINTVYNGINPDRFQPNPTPRDTILEQYHLPPNAQFLLYAGRIDNCKGIDVLIHAFAQLHAQHPQLHLLIAGTPNSIYQEDIACFESLKQQTQALHLNQYIHFIGHVGDLRPLYSTANLVVVPSRWPEPFGRVIIEAMACGTPIVASRMGGIPEILTGQFAQGLCQPNDPNELAHTIDRLLDWRTTQPHLGPASRDHILQNFSLTRTIQNIESTLLQVIANT
jgi:glycosyltransferase involved in cell wall biosynthesis